MPMSAQIDLGAGVARADRVEARIAQDNRHGAGLQIGAGRCADVVSGVNQTTVDVDKPFLAGLAFLRADQRGEIAFDVVRVALGSLSDESSGGTIRPWAQGGCGHLAVVFDKAGDNLGAAVVDTLGGVTVDQQSQRIVPGYLGDLGLCVLPTIPEPALVVVGAETDGVARHVLAIGGHKPYGGTAMQIANDNEQLRAGGFSTRHSLPRIVSRQRHKK